MKLGTFPCRGPCSGHIACALPRHQRGRRGTARVMPRVEAAAGRLHPTAHPGKNGPAPCFPATIKMPSGLRSGPLCPGVAWVTGGARGLGNAIAVSFAKEGAKGVVIVDVADEATMKKGKEAVEAVGTDCLVIRCDVTNEAQVEDAIAQTVKRFGRIDYAACFAGVVGPLKPIWEVDYMELQRVININLNGVWLCNKLLIKQMITQEPLDGIEPHRLRGAGSIVNCASVNSQLSNKTTSGYTAAKQRVNLFSHRKVLPCDSGVVGITKAACMDARGYGIRVNAVSPGYLETPASLLLRSDRGCQLIVHQMTKFMATDEAGKKIKVGAVAFSCSITDVK
jgi:NAD(P)-dependent dehydrogenase (short-subunit alcohol dehydrogenase family)